MILKKIQGNFVVCKVEDYSQVQFNSYCFLGKSEEENSLVCLEEDVPNNVIEKEEGWKAFRIQGVLDFSLIGILARISTILAENKIGIFVVSTFNTDYVLVKKENYQKALQVLSEQGYTVEE